MHRGEHRFVGFALLDLLVNAFLDENAFQRAEMQFVLELASPCSSSSRLSIVHQLRRVLAQHFGHGHLHRPIVSDDHDAAGDGRLRNR